MTDAQYLELLRLTTIYPYVLVTEDGTPYGTDLPLEDAVQLATAEKALSRMEG